MKRPRTITRRAAIRLGLATAGGAAVGCEPATPVRRGVVTTPDAAGDGRPAAADIAPARDAGIDSSPADAAAQPDVASPDSAPPDRTPPDAAPPDTEPESPLTPDELLAGIDTFVVLCMENRSFDHVLGARRLLEGRPVEGLRSEMNNPDRDGRPVLIHRLDGFSHVDPPHDWDPVHRQWNEGAMDGFVRVHPGPDAAQVMGYYTREEQPITWALADGFVTCDHWFSSVLGPTWPNRFYLHGATAMGVQTNAPALGLPTVFGRLEEVGKTHRNYFCDIAWATGGYLRLANNAGIESFFADARNGELPNVAFVDPQFFGAGANDDHPDHDVRLGQAFIGSVYAALRSSPQWNRCLLVVTYDEHGGFFDHLPPPAVTDENAAFRRLGVRVPGLVAGATVRRGATVAKTFDHVSVIATLTRRFGLRPLNDRVRATNDLSACIDPALVDNPRPGPALPPAPVIPMASLVERDRQLAGRPPLHHRELWQAAESLKLPPALDRRRQSLAVAEHWLSAGERLRALRLR